MIRVDALMTYPSRPFGHDKWCHLWDSEDDLEALHAFAARLGLRRSYFQDHPTMPHYDLTASKHALALRLGAHLATRQEMAAHVQARIERGRPAAGEEG